MFINCLLIIPEDFAFMKDNPEFAKSDFELDCKNTEIAKLKAKLADAFEQIAALVGPCIESSDEEPSRHKIIGIGA